MRGSGLSPERRARRLTVLRTVEFLAAFAALSVWLYVAAAAPILGPGLVSAGLAFLGIQALLIVSVMARVLVGKSVRSITERRRRRELPELRAYLAAYVSGRTEARDMSWWIRHRRRALEGCLVEFLPAVTGRRRKALVGLAVRAGLVERWSRAVGRGDVRDRLDAVMRLGLVAGAGARDRLLVALDDPLRAVRVEAARALLRVGAPEDARAILTRAACGSSFERIVLADHLRPHAGMFVEQILPDLEDAHDRAALVNALEMLASWRVSVSCPRISRYLGDSDPRVVEQALRALPYVAERDAHRGAVLEALTVQTPAVRRAAAFAAGRLGVESAVTVLGARLRDPDATVAHAAARALAGLGFPGRERLEAALTDRERSGARAALEALEHARLDRLRALAA